MRRLHQVLVPILLGICGCGAGKDGGSGPPPGSLELQYVSGADQTGTVGTQLAQPLVVRVVDEAGHGVAGVATDWMIATGGGNLSSVTATSGSDGSSSANWTLGLAAGISEVVVTVGTDVSLFQATVEAGPAADVLVIAGLDGSNGVGTTTTVFCQVIDVHGNPKADLSVTWLPSSGSVLPAADTSDINGLIETDWTRGMVPGVDTLRVVITGVPQPIVLTSITASPGR